MQFHNWCRPLMGAVVLVLAAVQGAEAQQPRPRPGQFEVHELDFRPKGAWRQRAAKVRAERQALLAAGNFAQLNSRAPGAAAPVVTGDFRIPVVPLQFSN
ncbi:MAG TPA: hypothetical protein VFV65_00845, partial [Gemmatimonadales bacterium]|nr:hypothetical protein [Gemmatimonadales bacterium]